MSEKALYEADTPPLPLAESDAADCGYEQTTDYVNETAAHRFWGEVLYVLIRIIFPPVLGLIYGFKITGRENFEKLNGGAVVVYNHVHCLDCIMAACAVKRPHLYYVTIQQNMDIPVAGKIIDLLGAWPLPQSVSGLRNFKRRCAQVLKAGECLVVCPEGERKKTYGTLRPFKPGAFSFANENNVPVLPCVVKKVKCKGLRRTRLIFEILPPIYPTQEKTRKAAEAALCENTRAAMLAAL